MQIHVDVDERLDPAHGRDVDPFGESNVLTGERLDVADLAQQSLLSALPMGLRCAEIAGDSAQPAGRTGMRANARASPPNL